MDDTFLEDIGQSDVQKFIGKKVDGEIQKQYFKSIAVMDKAVENIYNALDEKGVLDHSYILFASDNGGCPTAGGRNYPLRGTKGSLFEGGVHVEAFIFSPMLSSKLQGSAYDNLFHVSDWFPTILSTAGIAYVRYGTYAIDGVSHYDALISDGKSPRETLLYNYYYDPSRYILSSLSSSFKCLSMVIPYLLSPTSNPPPSTLLLPFQPTILTLLTH